MSTSRLVIGHWPGRMAPGDYPLDASHAVNALAHGQVAAFLGAHPVMGPFSILLQSRGSGLGGTFGGDSAVYRSRRGIERRLWQFTIILIVLFVLFSLSAYVFSPTVLA